MNQEQINALDRFLDVLGLDEEPMGIFYTDAKPSEGFSPRPMDLPTREKEMKNEIDWQTVFGQFSCVMGNIWRARKFFKIDELSFSVTFQMFCQMQDCFQESFLMTKTWPIVQKKIIRSKRAWNEVS